MSAIASQISVSIVSLQWRHNGRDSVSNHQLSRLIRSRSKKTSGLCAGNSPETGEFPAQRASNAENVSIWWRHHVTQPFVQGRSKKTSNLRVTGLCEGKSSVTGEFLSQSASNAENLSIWWGHNVSKFVCKYSFSARHFSVPNTSGFPMGPSQPWMVSDTNCQGVWQF